MDLHQTLAPFILATDDRLYEEGKELGTSGRKFSWMLYAMRDGAATWYDSDGQPHRLTPTAPLLTWRAMKGPLIVAPRAHVMQITFDVVPRTREPHPELGWRPVLNTMQPGVRKILGVRPPHLLEDPMLARATQHLLERVCVRWWRSPQDQVVCNMMLAGWIGTLIEACGNAQTAAPDAIDQAEHFARHALSTGCTIADMARHVGMSPSTFADHFQTARGETPGSFLHRIRMEQASDLLLNTPVSIQDIAQRCGYTNRTSFSRAFKETYGSSPQGYRRQHNRSAVSSHQTGLVNCR